VRGVPFCTLIPLVVKLSSTGSDDDVAAGVLVARDIAEYNGTGGIEKLRSPAGNSSDAKDRREAALSVSAET